MYVVNAELKSIKTA